MSLKRLQLTCMGHGICIEIKYKWSGELSPAEPAPLFGFSELRAAGCVAAGSAAGLVDENWAAELEQG